MDYLVVHCSATKPNQDIGRSEIDQWHRQRGFLTIGYHFVIRRSGALEVGRPIMTVGAHVKGHNHNSIGICLVGGIDSKGNPEDNFTKSQYTTLETLCTVLPTVLPNNGVEILGHRDFPNVHKDCPCFDVKSWWESVK